MAYNAYWWDTRDTVTQTADGMLDENARTHYSG